MIQWISSQANCRPTFGRKPVISSRIIEIPITPWNRREARLWRWIFCGRPGSSGALAAAFFSSPIQRLRSARCRIRKTPPAINAIQNRLQSIPMSTFSPHGFVALWKKFI